MWVLSAGTEQSICSKYKQVGGPYHNEKVQLVPIIEPVGHKSHSTHLTVLTVKFGKAQMERVVHVESEIKPLNLPLMAHSMVNKAVKPRSERSRTMVICSVDGVITLPWAYSGRWREKGWTVDMFDQN